jgi:tRNA threonylcarbamoyladenosine biosynthesis protein TsaB
MALLLSLETTAHSFSCALHQQGELIASREITEPQSTASMLAPAIEEIFQQSGLKKNQLEGVVVAAGPGSYTGLRIGTATAKGICYALNIPLISVNSLRLMAYQVASNPEFILADQDLLCPMLDARRMEVYCMLLQKDLKVISETEAKVLDENSFQDIFSAHTIYFFGDGSEKFKSVVKNPQAKFIEAIHPSAVFLGKLGEEKFSKGEFEDLEKYEPFYLKDFVIKKPNLVS